MSGVASMRIREPFEAQYHSLEAETSTIIEFEGAWPSRLREEWADVPWVGKSSRNSPGWESRKIQVIVTNFDEENESKIYIS